MPEAQTATSNTSRLESEQVRAGLEQIRLRLLDLTSRNKLISFRHANSALRIVDADLDQLYLALLSNQKLPFVDVPEPTREELSGFGEKPPAKEYAETLGWSVSFDLEEAHGRRDSLPVLHYREDFEASIRKIGTTARTAVEESGVNLLHLIFGFLEWRESDDSTQVRHAPLIVVPVNLITPKSNDADRSIRLHYTGDDLTTNLSLVEKMRRDFGIEIPVLQEEETPEQYFLRFKELLEYKREWRICRQVSLGLLSFGKLLMYLDLNADRWPDFSPLEKHPRLVDIFTGNKAKGMEFATEYDLDEETKRAQIPSLICDADSSQHSALIDAARGNNLVIEGPPGTGKSQTITNLIAAFLSQGKRVLFVAEKMAALNVVKRRLDQSRLGDFCLELHSHKTSKVGLLKSLESRIAAHRSFAGSSLLGQKTMFLSNRQEELTRYVTLLNRPNGATAMSPFEVIWRRDALGRDLTHEAFHPTGQVFPGCHEWSVSDVEDRKERIGTYQAHLVRFREAGGSFQKSENPWGWLPSCDLNLDKQQELLELLQKLRDLCTAQCVLIEAFQQMFQGVISNPDDWLQKSDTWMAHLPKESCIDTYRELYGPLSDSHLRETIRSFVVDVRSFELASKRLPGGNLLLDADLGQEIEQLVAHPAFAGLLDFDLDRLDQIVRGVITAKTQSLPAERALREMASALEVDVTFSVRCLGDLLTARKLLESAPFELLFLRHVRFASDGLSHRLRAWQQESEDLASQSQALSKDYLLDTEIPISDFDQAASVLESTPWYLRWFSASYKDAQRCFARHAIAHEKRSPAQMAAGLRRLSQGRKRVSSFLERSEIASALGDEFKGLETAWQDLHALSSWYEQVAVQLPEHLPFASLLRRALLTQPSARLKAVISSPATRVPGADDLKGLFESLEILNGLLPHIVFDRAEVNIEEFLRECQPIADHADLLLKKVAPLGFTPTTTKREIVDTTSEASRLREARLALSNDKEVKGILRTLFAGLDSDCEGIARTASFVEKLQQAELPSDLKSWLLCDDYPVRSTWLNEWLKDFTSNTQLLAFVEDEVRRVLGSDLPFAKRHILPALKKAIAGLDLCLASAPLLPMWIDVRREADRVKVAGLEYLVNAATTRGVPIEQLRNGFEYLFYDSLVRRLFAENPDIWQLTGITHEETRRRFSELDEAVIELTQLDVAFRASRHTVPQGVRGTTVKETTELALIHHEIGKQKQHIPVRQLLLRAGGAVQALKPCFMMSPMSVAQFLAPGRIHFDLVVMDEASQLRPEDALGAIARGTQLVVVGDPKQLPPTSFFQRTLNDEEDSEDKTIVAEGESILDIALGRYQPVRRLRWHYRSQHHSLIAFSNQEFYGGDLVVFPSAYHEHPELGVKYVAAAGIYENRRNPLEAERVVDAILEHILLYPGQSLGVVTMNFDQRELIEELLDAKLATDSFSKTWIESKEETPEPFFIKNLENVQGDERDVIFISVTYGKDAQGSMFQRFAGVNTASGQRRLNVMITRAKKRTVVFSSLDGDDIQVTPSTPWGVKALKGYLDFAKKGISAQPVISPGAEPSNQHEAAVGAVLKEHGYDVVPQVGVSGYFIDLAIRHPKKSGSWLLGVEFDGKSYHSGRSARDRDRLRQMTLERQGWKIHRIWSTDWFKNRDTEIDRLLKRVRSLEAIED